MKSQEQRKEKKINVIEDRAYSSVHSIVSFVISFAYIIVDVVCIKCFENPETQKNIASLMLAILLLISVVISHIWIRNLRRNAETDYKRMNKICSVLKRYARGVGYASHILLAITLIVSVIV